MADEAGHVHGALNAESGLDRVEGGVAYLMVPEQFLGVLDQDLLVSGQPLGGRALGNGLNGIEDLAVDASGNVYLSGEFSNNAFKITSCGDCPTDANGDSETGPFDLASLLACWGPVAPGCECFDANGNGMIDPFDLATLLANWGPCP